MCKSCVGSMDCDAAGCDLSLERPLRLAMGHQPRSACQLRILPFTMVCIVCKSGLFHGLFTARTAQAPAGNMQMLLATAKYQPMLLCSLHCVRTLVSWTHILPHRSLHAEDMIHKVEPTTLVLFLLLVVLCGVSDPAFGSSRSLSLQHCCIRHTDQEQVTTGGRCCGC